jgi:hypothetical protein
LYSSNDTLFLSCLQFEKLVLKACQIPSFLLRIAAEESDRLIMKAQKILFNMAMPTSLGGNLGDDFGISKLFWEHNDAVADYLTKSETLYGA